MGLVVFGAVALYLVLAIFVVTGAVSHARKLGKNVKHWGWGAALVMYLIPFWDWIPTVAMHQYYCTTEAGFWVYKTPEQWKKENPGVMETLLENNRSPNGMHANWPHERRSDMDIAHINQRFVVRYKDHFSSQEDGQLFLHVWRWQYELLDKKTGEVLARQVDFSTGDGRIGGEPPIKFWLQNEHCATSKEQSQKFWEFIKPFKGAKI